MPELTEDPLLVNGTTSTSDTSNSDSDSEAGAVPPLLAPKQTDLGKRVLFYSIQDKKQKYGVLRFLGPTEFSEGMWCGIELDKPVGKNNGSIHGIRYFVCDSNHGVFVPLAKVELDTSRRSRSRPNSAPSSRNSSLERKKQSNNVPASNSSPKMNPYILQKDLANRLSQPVMHKRKAGPSAMTSYRQPMKAFATKDVKREETGTKKNVLSPFRAGGMVKAQSTENLRGLNRDKEKNHGHMKAGMPSKKSSSERDLRSSSTGNLSGKSSNKTANKPLKKKGRVNSCSDLLDSSSTTSGSSGSSASRKSADASSLFSKSSTTLVWPRTSTPGNRDDQTPDGCSSPDDMSDSHSRIHSASTLVGNNSLEETENPTPDIKEKAFILTPEPSTSASVSTSSVQGLDTQAKQFKEKERISPSLEDWRGPSPEGHASKQCYKNKPAGSATLTHPLTSVAIVSSGEENGSMSGSSGVRVLSPREFIKSVSGPNQTLVGVSVNKLEEVFTEQYRLWHSTQVLLEDRVRQLERQVQEQSAELGKYQRLLQEAEDSKSMHKRERSHSRDSLNKTPSGEERISRHTTV